MRPGIIKWLFTKYPDTHTYIGPKLSIYFSFNKYVNYLLLRTVDHKTHRADLSEESLTCVQGCYNVALSIRCIRLRRVNQRAVVPQKVVNINTEHWTHVLWYLGVFADKLYYSVYPSVNSFVVPGVQQDKKGKFLSINW